MFTIRFDHMYNPDQPPVFLSANHTLTSVDEPLYQTSNQRAAHALAAAANNDEVAILAMNPSLKATAVPLAEAKTWLASAEEAGAY